MSVEDCRLVNLPKYSDDRGSLSFVEGGRHIPFDIRRVYYLYDMPVDAERGAHGHLALEQLIVPISGAFDIILDDGTRKKVVHLDNPAQGLYVCPMMWRNLCNFTSDAVVLVFASLPYDEADYFRDYNDFIKAAVKS